MFLMIPLTHARSPHWHSGDLDDMRRAILDEDEDCDGPDGGCPDVIPLTVASRSRT